MRQADRDYWLADQFGPHRYMQEHFREEKTYVEGWEVPSITPGFFQIGSNEEHLLWVDERGFVRNGSYWLWYVDGSEDTLALHPGLYKGQMEFHGEVWPPYLARRVGYEWEGMPWKGGTPARFGWNYNEVIEAFRERRALGLAMQSAEESGLAAAYYRNPNTEDDWSRYL